MTHPLIRAEQMAAAAVAGVQHQLLEGGGDCWDHGQAPLPLEVQLAEAHAQVTHLQEHVDAVRVLCVLAESAYPYAGPPTVAAGHLRRAIGDA